MKVENLRRKEIEYSISKIKNVMRDGINIENLNQAKTILLHLASKSDLFQWADFPLPSNGETYRTFLVYQEDAGGNSLYVNSSLPGQQSSPHDHGGAWVIVASVEGEELHRVYKPNFNDGESDMPRISLSGEILVKPGTAISLLPDGIHSIHAESNEPLLHLHLYSKGFEFQGEKNQYNLDTGGVKRFKLEDVGIIEDAR